MLEDPQNVLRDKCRANENQYVHGLSQVEGMAIYIAEVILNPESQIVRSSQNVNATFLE